ncbi:MAG TPA: sigma-70 family RNA polymerase sigma factor [Bacteroidia bacterium]|nr:sigma-70 family RNA polymerase sigma factor [Bacteroidia bacterium]
MSIHKFVDKELVQLYLGGKEEALEVLLDRHKSRIFSSVISLVRDRQAAEDIFQETFYKVILTLKRGQYAEEGKFLPWVLRIARNLVIDHFRTQRKLPPIPVYINEEGEEVSVFDSIAAEDDHDLPLERLKLRKNMRSLISELPEDQREVVIMRMYYDMSFKEIAEFSQVSINTSLGRMRYALINLKKIIEHKHLELAIR